MKLKLIVLSLAILAGAYHKTAFGQSWQPVSTPPFLGKVTFVNAHPREPSTLFIGAGGDLYSSTNEGKDWKKLIHLGQSAVVHKLRFEQERLFLLTSEGLFESTDDGDSWQHRFRGRSSSANVFSIRQDPLHEQVFYLATGGGLFESEDHGSTWHPTTSELAHQSITTLETDLMNRELFIAGERGLYRSIPHRNRLDHVYDAANSIQSILAVSKPVEHVLIATLKGVWKSEDEGNTWTSLPQSGLETTAVHDLAYSNELDTLVAATDRGVYQYNEGEKHWRKLHAGLPRVRVHGLALTQGGNEVLYAATDQGVYRIQIDVGGLSPEILQPVSMDRWQLLDQLYRAEPTVRALQKEAISYSNVSHWKTRRWQWGSRLRALIPSFSVGKSYSSSNNVNLDRASSSVPDAFIEGPHDTSKGWNFDVGWDLSELLWSTAQTSIDSREKSTVDLREEILSQVTRLYFERRRAQAEFVLEPPLDPLGHVSALLRIDELTASLDALTNGALTRQLTRIYQVNADLHKIWH